MAQHLHLAISLGGYLGALLVLSGYVLTTSGRATATARTVQLTNTSGALLLVVNGVGQAAWPSVGLNLVWIVVGLVAARRVRGQAAASPEAGETRSTPVAPVALSAPVAPVAPAAPGAVPSTVPAEWSQEWAGQWAEQWQGWATPQRPGDEETATVPLPRLTERLEGRPARR